MKIAIVHRDSSASSRWPAALEDLSGGMEQFVKQQAGKEGARLGSRNRKRVQCCLIQAVALTDLLSTLFASFSKAREDNHACS